MTLEQQLQTGLSYQQSGRFAEAEKIYREVLALQPNHPDALHLLGMLAGQMGRLDVAEDLLQRAIQRNPDSAQAHNNLGFVLAGKGRREEAIASYQRAVGIKPDLAEAQSNLGAALSGAGRPSEAIAAYRQVIRLKPEFAEAHNNLGNLLMEVGQFDQAVASYRQAIRVKANYTVAHSNLLYALHYHPEYDARMIHAEGRRWNQMHAEPLEKFIQPHTNNRDPERRLRVGYVSADFYGHASAFFLLPLLRYHDRRQFESFCYALNANSDSVTQQMKNQAQHWRTVADRPDPEIAACIREDKIDILVDLKLHTANNHLLIFAHKPAPVQVTWLGYPGTTGMDTIDYRLTDPYMDPSGLDDPYYSERSIRLPNTFWCYDPLTDKPATNDPPCQEAGFTTFGCLNNFRKVNDRVVTLWGQVLKAVDRSRLIVLSPDGSHRRSFLDLMQREGINPDRIEMVARLPRPQYLELHHRIDVGLDTLPYNGHTTSLDSLWMGVPVVSLVGQTAVGRAGLSQLTNLGLLELVARTPEQYVRIAAGLAEDLPRLTELRRTLRLRMEASPLMDAPLFARGIKAVYRELWRTWCAEGGSQKP
jgi:protein O-GlcNAc transferase